MYVYKYIPRDSVNADICEPSLLNLGNTVDQYGWDSGYGTGTE